MQTGRETCQSVSFKALSQFYLLVALLSYGLKVYWEKYPGPLF